MSPLVRAQGLIVFALGLALTHWDAGRWWWRRRLRAGSRSFP
ncbi:MAG: hypothetical protein WBF75_23175 [Pseudonocardiaceae bacterium]